MAQRRAYLPECSICSLVLGDDSGETDAVESRAIGESPQDLASVRSWRVAVVAISTWYAVGWIWDGAFGPDFAPVGRVVGSIGIGIAWAVIAFGVVRRWKFAGLAAVALGSLDLVFLVLTRFMQDFWWLLLVAADVMLILAARHVARIDRVRRRA